MKKISIEIFDNRVIISNPGGLPKGLDIKNFGRLSMARNPIITSLLQRSDYIEKMGTGINRIRDAMKIASLPEPDFTMDGFFTVALQRESYKAESVGDNVGFTDMLNFDHYSLSATEKSVFELIQTNSHLSSREIADKLDKSPRTIERCIAHLKEVGLLARQGSDRGGIWIVKV